MMYNAQIEKLQRQYLPQNLVIDSKEVMIPFFEELLSRKIQSVEALKKWLSDSSELQAALSEDVCWRQIKMTCDTENKILENHFQDYVLNIEPHLKPLAHELNKKFINSVFLSELGAEYEIYIRSVKNAVELFNENNIALESEVAILAQQYAQISGRMFIELDGKEFTMQQAAKFLQQSDRTLRENVFYKMAKRRLQDKESLDKLMDKLVALRHQIALNAGFENYRDYMFKALGRFDYTPEDCFSFHASVKKHILPLVEKMYEKKKKALQLSTLKPWDLDAVAEGTQPLKPFVDGKELSDKAIKVFSKLNSFFADCIRQMQDIHHLDLDSRKGKAPGGYNCPLAETGVPFIFMNAAGTADDVITFMHEGGHAFHSFLSHHLSLAAFKEYPMEMAELASMSMELFTFNYWQEFYPKADDFHRAQNEQLERVLSIFPWIATIDKFQHWMYLHPSHSAEERKTAWVEILNEFYPKNIDVSGLEEIRYYQWQKQLHLYEVPFYYIEYGIAQLGAIAMWQQYIEKGNVAIENYLQALSLGYTKNLKELYKTAGIAFDFSDAYVKQLATFVSSKMD